MQKRQVKEFVGVSSAHQIPPNFAPPPLSPSHAQAAFSIAVTRSLTIPSNSSLATSSTTASHLASTTSPQRLCPSARTAASRAASKSTWPAVSAWPSVSRSTMPTWPPRWARGRKEKTEVMILGGATRRDLNYREGATKERNGIAGA